MLVVVVPLPVGSTVLAWSRTGTLRDQVAMSALWVGRGNVRRYCPDGLGHCGGSLAEAACRSALRPLRLACPIRPLPGGEDCTQSGMIGDRVGLLATGAARWKRWLPHRVLCLRPRARSRAGAQVLGADAK